MKVKFTIKERVLLLKHLDSSFYSDEGYRYVISTELENAIDKLKSFLMEEKVAWIKEEST